MAESKLKGGRALKCWEIVERRNPACEPPLQCGNSRIFGAAMPIFLLIHQ
jgi:hypothetical protein